MWLFTVLLSAVDGETLLFPVSARHVNTARVVANILLYFSAVNDIQTDYITVVNVNTRSRFMFTFFQLTVKYRK